MPNTGRAALGRAKSAKDDEFYTRRVDIDKELNKYNWKDKTVLCPCDSKHSKFVEYFKEQDCKLLYSDGDFRSPETAALREQADVIVTNPPFSLFREFYKWVGNKDFVILGTFNMGDIRGPNPRYLLS
jgi:hypothetical protein